MSREPIVYDRHFIAGPNASVTEALGSAIRNLVRDVNDPNLYRESYKLDEWHQTDDEGLIRGSVSIEFLGVVQNTDSFDELRQSLGLSTDHDTLGSTE